MALSDADRAVVRSHIGLAEPPSDVELDAIHDRVGSVEEVALEVLRGRLAALTAGPLKFSIDGDASQDATMNAKLLSGQISALEATVGATESGLSSMVGVGRLVRPDRRR